MIARSGKEFTYADADEQMRTLVGTEDVKKRASWIGEVDIGIMKKIFASPREGHGYGHGHGHGYDRGHGHSLWARDSGHGYGDGHGHRHDHGPWPLAKAMAPSQGDGNDRGHGHSLWPWLVMARH